MPRAILRAGVRDLTGGFKCFRRAVLESIDIESIRSRGYGFQIELTYRALVVGFDVVEIRSLSAIARRVRARCRWVLHWKRHARCRCSRCGSKPERVCRRRRASDEPADRIRTTS